MEHKDDTNSNLDQTVETESETTRQHFSFQDLCSISSLRSLSAESAHMENTETKVLKIPNRDFYPMSSRPPILDLFQETVEQDLKNLDTRTKSKQKHSYNNLTNQEIQALKQLRNNKDLSIRPVDKGGGVAVINSSLYHKLNVEILSDDKTYRKLSTDPTVEIQKSLKSLLSEGVNMGVFDQKQSDKLYVEHPVRPIFHSFPKTHKNIFPPPLRPIVSGIGSIGERLGEWLDLHLQPLVTPIPGYIQDSKHVVMTLDNAPWDATYAWVSCDVIGLYPSIPHEAAIGTLSKFIKNHSRYNEATNQFIISAAAFLLRHNYFSFDGQFYVQQCGAPMGGKYSPSLANIYVAGWEEIFLYSPGNCFSSHIRWYGRYIDDLLLVWEGDQTQANQFLNYINDNEFNLRFTMVYNQSEINFLDLTLEGTNGGVINIAPYRKPTATNATLMATSCHPQHVMANIPVGELVRYKRNTTLTKVYQKHQFEVCERLKQRGYSNKIIQSAIHKVEQIPRENLLTHKSSRFKTSEPNQPSITFSTQYSPQFPAICNIIKRYLPMLTSNDNLRATVDQGVRFVSRKAPTLGSTLSPSLFTTQISPNMTWLNTVGFHSCGHTHCLVCGHIQKQKSFESYVTGQSYKLTRYMNCNTKNLIYIINCVACRKQYVGCTTNAFKTRIRKHLSDAKPGLNLNVSTASKHFSKVHGGDTSHFKCMAIEKVDPPIRGGDLHKKILARESYWIFELQTRTPLGFNKKYDILCHY